MESVASEAGVARATVYRRYRDKADLITAAIAGNSSSHLVPGPAADPRADLVRYLSEFDDRFAEGCLEVVGTLIGSREDPWSLALHRERVVGPRFGYARSLLEQARGLGQLRADADIDLALQMLAGSVFARRVAGTTSVPGWAERAVDTIWTGMGEPVVAGVGPGPQVRRGRAGPGSWRCRSRPGAFRTCRLRLLRGVRHKRRRRRRSASGGPAATPGTPTPSARPPIGHATRGCRCRPGPRAGRRWPSARRWSPPPASPTSDQYASRARGSRASARSTSRQMTLPDPSHTPLTGLWRNRRGSIDSSTKPLPPMHSSASAACRGARLHVQYLMTGVRMRWSSCSCSSPAGAS